MSLVSPCVFLDSILNCMLDDSGPFYGFPSPLSLLLWWEE